MSKIKIKLLFLGHPRHVLDRKKLGKLSSKFFKIDGMESIENLPEAKKDDGYLDVEYSTEEVSDLVSKCKFDGIVFAIMNYPYDDGFYLHRLSENSVCLSIAGIDQLLLNNNISLENFIIKNIYEVVALHKILTKLDSCEAYSIVHSDTRGCLFDLNGDKFDVIYNTEKPKLCEACKSYINGASTPDGFVSNLEKELKKIRKPLVSTIEVFIKKYPLFSVSLTLVSSFFISVLASVFVDFMKLNVSFSEVIKAIVACSTTG